MRGPASVCIDDNFTSCQSSISSWASFNERSRGVDNNLGVSEHVGGAHSLDDLLGEHILDGLIVDIGVVLSRNQDVVDTNRDDLASVFLILNDNL